MKEDYFLTSGDKIRYFWEAEATDDNGELNRPKHKALNKIGHGKAPTLAHGAAFSQRAFLVQLCTF